MVARTAVIFCLVTSKCASIGLEGLLVFQIAVCWQEGNLLLRLQDSEFVIDRDASFIEVLAALGASEYRSDHELS